MIQLFLLINLVYLRLLMIKIILNLRIKLILVMRIYLFIQNIILWILELISLVKIFILTTKTLRLKQLLKQRSFLEIIDDIIWIFYLSIFWIFNEIILIIIFVLKNIIIMSLLLYNHRFTNLTAILVNINSNFLRGISILICNKLFWICRNIKTINILVV